MGCQRNVIPLETEGCLVGFPGLNGQMGQGPCTTVEDANTVPVISLCFI